MGHVAHWLYFAGRIDEASAVAEESLELFPDFWFLHFVRSNLAFARRDRAAAIDSIGRAVELTDGKLDMLLSQAATFSFFFGDEAEGNRWWARFEELARTTTVSPCGYFNVEAVQGNIDPAIAWLERARRDHDPFFPWMRAATERSGLTRDPRILDAMERLGLP
jgi:hypothetical protein